MDSKQTQEEHLYMPSALNASELDQEDVKKAFEDNQDTTDSFALNSVSERTDRFGNKINTEIGKFTYNKSPKKNKRDSSGRRKTT